jgi:hypothetical protein
MAIGAQARTNRRTDVTARSDNKNLHSDNSLIQHPNRHGLCYCDGN